MVEILIKSKSRRKTAFVVCSPCSPYTAAKCERQGPTSPQTGRLAENAQAFFGLDAYGATAYSPARETHRLISCMLDDRGAAPAAWD